MLLSYGTIRRQAPLLEQVANDNKNMEARNMEELQL
jgi:hypothetical protein